MSPVKFPKSEKYNFTKNLVKRHKLVGHLDRYLGTEVKDFEFKYEPKKIDIAWHPSGHCTMSVSELYDYAQPFLDPNTKVVMKNDHGVALNKTFLVGHFWHQLLQKAVLDLGLAEPSAIERRGIRGWGEGELKIDPTNGMQIMVEPGIPWHTFKPLHWATGAGDVAPCSIPGHGDYVVDFKTMSSHQFKSNGLPDWCKDKYEAQINIYLDFFDLEKGLIIPIQKDSPHDLREVEFVRNQPLIDAIYQKWEFVSILLDEGIEPELDSDGNDVDVFPLHFTGPIAQ